MDMKRLAELAKLQRATEDEPIIGEAKPVPSPEPVTAVHFQPATDEIFVPMEDDEEPEELPDDGYSDVLSAAEELSEQPEPLDKIISKCFTDDKAYNIEIDRLLPFRSPVFTNTGDISALKDNIIEELGDRIFCNPAKNTGGRYSGWEIAEEYLSGHVRSKLALAQEVAKSDPDFERNVTALLENQPPRVNIGDIGFRLGTIYIPAEMFQQFIYDTFQTPEWLRRKSNGIYSKDIFVAYSPEMNIWKVKNASGMSDVLSTQTFGTKRANAYELTELLLKQKRAAIYDYRENADGKKERIFNAKERPPYPYPHTQHRLKEAACRLLRTVPRPVPPDRRRPRNGLHGV